MTDTYKGRVIRYAKTDYLIAGCFDGDRQRRQVTGWAVDCGQIPRIAVRKDGKHWAVDDWDTGASIIHAGLRYPSRLSAVRAALDRLALMGQAEYERAKARLARSGGLNARSKA